MMARVSTVIELDVDNGTPVLRPRGYYSDSETYVYNNEFRDSALLDVLTSDGRRVTYYFVVRKLFDEVKGVAPVPGDTSSSRRWVESEKAEFIVANSISAEMLQAGAVTADKLQVAGFNFEDNNIWGGAKFGAGEGIGIVSISGDRAFRAYKDTNNYVEMFQRTNEWGMVGRTSSGGELFRLGQKYTGGKWVDSNVIAGWRLKSSGIESDGFVYPTFSSDGYSVSKAKGSRLFTNGGLIIAPGGTGILAGSTGLMQAALIAAIGDNALVSGLQVYAECSGSMKEAIGLIVSAKNTHLNPSTMPVAIKAKGDIYHYGGYYDEVFSWYFISGGSIPIKGRRCVRVTGNTSSNNYCSISTDGVQSGQVITIVNGQPSNRLNITNTVMGEHHIRGGCCCTFRYAGGWYPERFE